jgi:hypothetical protein
MYPELLRASRPGWFQGGYRYGFWDPTSLNSVVVLQDEYEDLGLVRVGCPYRLVEFSSNLKRAEGVDPCCTSLYEQFYKVRTWHGLLVLRE